MERGQSGCDRLFKIHPLIDILNKNFRECAEFEEHYSVDEQIVLIKGHHGLKVYITIGVYMAHAPYEQIGGVTVH